MISSQKKILLVTETPPATPNGFGITLKNLFQNFNCKVVYTDKSFKNHSIPQNYVFAHCPNHKSKRLLPLFLLGLIPEWRGKYSSLWLNLFLRSNFDVVYCFFYSLENVKFADWIASQKNAKLIVHIADHSECFFKDSYFNSIIQKSYKRACIGKNMQEAYEKEFNLKFEIFHNFADARKLPFKSKPSSSFTLEKPLKLLFIGSIFKHLHQGAIEDICTAVNELHTLGKPISFDIYGQVQPADYIKNKINNTSVFYRGEIKAENRFDIMEQYHAYVVPSSFEENLSANYSFSIPTKLPELLGSGRPTLIYGPSNMEAHRFCKKLDSGILIEEQGIQPLKTEISNLIEDYNFQYSKAQSDVIRTCDQLFGEQKQNEFVKFLLN